jgi:hypothetical protein
LGFIGRVFLGGFFIANPEMGSPVKEELEVVWLQKMCILPAVVRCGIHCPSR